MNELTYDAQREILRGQRSAAGNAEHSADLRTNKLIKCAIISTTIAVTAVLAGCFGGFYVYNQGPGFLGLVPDSYGVQSYSELLAEHIKTVSIHNEDVRLHNEDVRHHIDDVKANRDLSDELGFSIARNAVLLEKQKMQKQRNINLKEIINEKNILITKMRTKEQQRLARLHPYWKKHAIDGADVSVLK